MSKEVLTELRERTAFKPKPPDYELALAHVPLSDVGLQNAVEDRILGAMRTDDEAFVLVVAPPGGGKSSLLAWAAAESARGPGPPKVLPVYVPVGHHAAQIDAGLIVRGVSEGVAMALAGDLSRRDREKLEKALAVTITTGRRTPGLRAGLSTPPLHGLSASAAVDLGGDLTTLVAQGGWQGGSHAGLVALSDLVRAHGGHLVVLIEDTDIWSSGDENMARRAAGFFEAMRSLLGCPEVTIVVAAQSHWGEILVDPRKRDRNTVAARLQFRELRERVGRVLVIPTPASHDDARALVAAVLERRVLITLDAEPPEAGWCNAIFSPEALELLGRRCLDGSVRQSLADVRDALDHFGELPDRIERDHIASAMSA